MGRRRKDYEESPTGRFSSFSEVNSAKLSEPSSPWTRPSRPSRQSRPWPKNELIQYEHSRQRGRRSPYVAVGICFLLMIIGLLLYPTSIYRTGIRFVLDDLYGAEIVNGRYAGGFRSLSALTYIWLALGLPTLVGGLIFTLFNTTAPTPSGALLRFSRFLHRKPWPRWLGLSFGELLFALLILWINGLWFVSYLMRKLEDVDAGAEGYQVWAVYGETFGLNVVLNMIFLGLPITRNSFWVEALGIDYTHCVKYHRWMGYFTFVVLLAHIVPYLVSWSQQNVLSNNLLPCFSCDIGAEARDPFQNFCGVVAAVAYAVIILTSISYVRRRWYELFYYSHHLFVLVLVGSALHYSSFVIWLYPILCLYLLQSILSRTQRKHPVELVDLQALPSGLVRVVFRRSLKQGGQYMAGQFVYFRIPSISSYEWHVFSISSYPQQSNDTVTVHIKDSGTWTRQLYALAILSEKQKGKPMIFVDGYYGKSSIETDRYPVLVFVAGGIGATPLLSLLGNLVHALRDGAHVKCREIHFFWTSRELALYKEFEPLLNKLRALDPEKKWISIQLHFTGKKEQGKVTMPTDVPTPTFMAASHQYPFHQSAVSPKRRSVLFLVVFLSSFFLLVLIRSDYKVLGNGNEYQHLWPLQRFVELMVVIGGALLGHFVAGTEKRPIPRDSIKNHKGFQGLDYIPESRESLGDAEMGVSHRVSKKRLNVSNALAGIYEANAQEADVKEAGIGVWVSGPQPLIKAVEVDAASFGNTFDVHYEEFHL